MTPSSALRKWRRILRGLRVGGRAEIVFDPAYSCEPPVSAHDPARAKRILSFLAAEGLAGRRRIHHPASVPLRSLRRVHTDDYLDSLQSSETLLGILGQRAADERNDAYVESHKRVVGGTLAAARLALSRRTVAANLGGGFHHASADRGQGFCVFNDVAVAVAEERTRGFEGPVLVVDLDLHDGDGTREIFARDPSVHTFSIHNRHLASPEAMASTSVALGDGIGDDAYLDAIRSHLPPVLEIFRPDLVFYLAGCDPAADDRLGDWRVSARGMLERDRFVFTRVCRAGDAPLVILLAGGYGQSAWRYSARFLSWVLTGGHTIEPPLTDELTLAHYRRLSRLLRPGDLIRENRRDEWILTEGDVMEALGKPGSSGRLLDYYSRHGIELALERYGFMDRLRAKGFDRLTLDLDVDDHAGQTLRVYDGSDRTVLIELRVRRDASTVRGMELLRVEWLLLQNPRESFTSERPRLPGQSHPGLGLLRDVIALLVLACDRLGLDGIVFNPSHYHLAVQSQRFLRFLDPRDEGRFRSLRETLSPVPLKEATRVVEEGGVVDAGTGQRFTWTPAPMVLAVTARLKMRLEGESYEREVGDHRIRLRLDR